MPFWVNTIDPRRYSWVNIVCPRGRFRVRVLRYAAPLLRRRPRMPSICSASMLSLSRARAQVRFLRVPPAHPGEPSLRFGCGVVAGAPLPPQTSCALT